MIQVGHAALRKRDVPYLLLLIIRGSELQELELRDDLFDDFCLDPFHPRELEARIKHMLAMKSKALLVNESSTASFAGLGNVRGLVNASLDLTSGVRIASVLSSKSRTGIYQRGTSAEFGATKHGGKNRGCSYSPPRAKLGEEHASLIHTVRSVGRLGESRRR